MSAPLTLATSCKMGLRTTLTYKTCQLNQEPPKVVGLKGQSWFDLVKSWVLPLAEPPLETVATCYPLGQPTRAVAHAVLVSQDTPAVRRWVQELNQRVRQDAELNAWATGSRPATLRIEDGYLECLGVSQNFWDSQVEGTEGPCPVASAPDVSYAQQHLMAVLLDADQQSALGFCTFSLTWSSRNRRTEGRVDDATLDIAVGQLWIHPDARGLGLSHLLSRTLGFAAQRSLAEVAFVRARARYRRPNVSIVLSGHGAGAAAEPFILQCQEQLEEFCHDTAVQHMAASHSVPPVTVRRVLADRANWGLDTLRWSA